MIEKRKYLEFDTPSEIRDNLLSYGYVRSFKEGAVILKEEECTNVIPIVLRGSIRVSRTDEEGREILLYYITPGESCVMSFLAGIHGDTSKLNAYAEEESELLLIPMDKVKPLMKDHPEWLDYILRLYHKRFEELLDLVNELTFKKADERLLKLLKRRAELSNKTTLQITHEQLANDLGTSRVVVSRLLKQMEAEGLLKLGRNKIELM